MSTAWTAADYARDAEDVRQDYRDMVADQLDAAAFEASLDYFDDRTPTRADAERDEHGYDEDLDGPDESGELL